MLLGADIAWRLEYYTLLLLLLYVHTIYDTDVSKQRC